jgi:hypothetical protein
MTTLLRRTFLAIAAAAVAGLAVAGGASAATIGSDLSLVPAIGLGDDATGAQLTAPAGAPNPITAPSAGVLVRVRLRYGATDANPGTVAFRILAGTDPFTARPATVDGGELRFPLPANIQGGTTGFIDYQPVDANGRPIGIPIAAGERLGVAQEKTGSAFIASSAASGTVGYVLNQHLSGSFDYTEVSGYELALQGVVEPDADGDRRGDETQDDCPTIPNNPTTGLCPPQLVNVPGPTVEVRKCHVPLLRGLTRGLANRLLNAAGCRLGDVRRRTVRRGRPGRVIKQSTRAGTVVDFGTRVGITLSRRARRG